MTAGCTIRIECLDDGRYRATCAMLPDFEAIADTEEEARLAAEDALRLELGVRHRPDSSELF